MGQDIPVERIKEIVKDIEHPEIAATFYELGMIGEAQVSGKRISLELLVPFPNIPIKDYLAAAVESAIKKEFSGASVSFTFSIMPDDVRNKFLSLARQRWKGEI